MTRKLTVFVVLVPVLVLLGATPDVPAKNGCGNGTLRGSYGIEATGAVLAGPLAGPIAIVGVLTYDGIEQVSGNLTQRVTTSTGPATLAKVPFAGTYLVNPDCTVEDSLLNLSNGTSSTHEAVIVANGREFVILNTTAGPTVIAGTGRKQFGPDGDRN